MLILRVTNSTMCHTIGFHPQTQNLEPRQKAPSFTLKVKGLMLYYSGYVRTWRETRLQYICVKYRTPNAVFYQILNTEYCVISQSALDYFKRASRYLKLWQDTVKSCSSGCKVMIRCMYGLLYPYLWTC